MAHIDIGPDGELVLVDPEAFGVVMAVAMHNHAISLQNCKSILEMNSERVEHFRNRANILEKPASEVVIVLANVDPIYGKAIADLLMPGFNWDEIRSRQETPFARGLAGREFVQSFLKLVDEMAYQKLIAVTSDVLSVVVIDQVCEVF